MKNLLQSFPRLTRAQIRRGALVGVVDTLNDRGVCTVYMVLDSEPVASETWRVISTGTNHVSTDCLLHAGTSYITLLAPGIP